MDKELGRYTCDNFTLINTSIIDNEELISTTIHEYVHMVLTRSSVLGIFQYCINKLFLEKTENNNFKIIVPFIHFISDRTKKIQEGLAVFIEAALWLCYDKKNTMIF